MDNLILAILSIFLPPLPVAIKRGLGFHFVVNCGLTFLLMWIPGVLHAMWVVFDDDTAA